MPVAGLALLTRWQWKMDLISDKWRIVCDPGRPFRDSSDVLLRQNLDFPLRRSNDWYDNSPGAKHEEIFADKQKDRIPKGHLPPSNLQYESTLVGSITHRIGQRQLTNELEVYDRSQSLFRGKLWPPWLGWACTDHGQHHFPTIKDTQVVDKLESFNSIIGTIFPSHIFEAEADNISDLLETGNYTDYGNGVAGIRAMLYFSMERDPWCVSSVRLAGSGKILEYYMLNTFSDMEYIVVVLVLLEMRVRLGRMCVLCGHSKGSTFGREVRQRK